MSAPRYVYVDFGAVRIQSYLSRTPNLRGRRAASATLARATAPDVIREAIGNLAEINEDAGEADGVVSLRFTSVNTVDPAIKVREVQDRVFAHLRRALPGAEFHSAWGVDETYLAAYAGEIKQRFESGEARLDLPSTAEFPLGRPCEVCRLDSAVGEEWVADELQHVCLDCSMRNVAHGSHAADHRSPEGRLTSVLPVTHPAPEEFTALARLSGPAKGGNQLATVFIDGNAVGQLFAALASDTKVSAEAKAGVSRALSEATRSALAAATLYLPLTEKLDQVCVVPHVVGGDDVLVSLPADQAWDFALGFLEQFAGLVNTAIAGVLGGERLISAVSASAGIVFAHATHPFNAAVESAGHLLSQAKKATRGQAASVQWLDVTADGPGAPQHAPLRLSDLRTQGRPTEAAKALTKLARVPASHRSTLAEALRQGGWITAATIARRVGRHRDAIDPFLPPFDAPSHEPPVGIDLKTALGLARWWPCTSR
jgi:hypothetical protein